MFAEVVSYKSLYFTINYIRSLSIFPDCYFWTHMTLTAKVLYSVGYPIDISISLEIISFSLSVKETSRVSNHPVWTSKYTGSIKTDFLVQLGLDSFYTHTRRLNRANPGYWLMYLLNRHSWENEPASYLSAISLGQLKPVPIVCREWCVTFLM